MTAAVVTFLALTVLVLAVLTALGYLVAAYLPGGLPL
jgi:hypothetical protein